MSNDYFRFKEFVINQRGSTMKVCTDSCLFGAWTVQHLKEEKNILDIGTGTGLLSLMIAQKSIALLDAIEYDNNAFLQAKENVHANSLSERIHVIKGDVRHYEFKHNYDFIITNPPFFESDLRSPEQSKNLAKHGTALNLQELITEVRRRLKATGTLSILLPYHRSAYFKKIASDQGFFPREELIVRQTPTGNPFRSFVLFSREQTETPIIKEMSIKIDGHYSEEFILLLKEYYEDIAFKKNI